MSRNGDAGTPSSRFSASDTFARSPLKSVTVASPSLRTWSATSAEYLSTLSSNLPAPLQSLTQSLLSPFLQPEPTTGAIFGPYRILDQYLRTSYTAVAASLLAVIFAVYSMSSYRSNFDPWGGRVSPYSAASGHPQVSDADFEYIVSPETHASGRAYEQSLPRNPSRFEDDANDPDILVLKYRQRTYPLHFKPYAISDELVNVGDVRKLAARELGASDYRRVRLLYKGKNLKDDSKSAKSQGLKQQSEIMCVVSEADPGEESGSSGTEVEANGLADGDGQTNTRRKRHRKSKNKTKSEKEDLANLAPRMEKVPSRTSRPSSRASSPQPPATTPMGKVEQLTSTFHTQYVPKCVQYISNPPTDRKAREFEHKKLSETILTQIIMKADDIQMDGDESARAQRKGLVIEAQGMLKRLDAVVQQR